MNKKYVSESQIIANDNLELNTLMTAVWAGKLTIVIVTFIMTTIAILYAVSLPNIYKSDVILAPANETSKFKVPGQLGGLATLAGLNVGGNGIDKTTLALEVLRSREFLSTFIKDNDLFVPIMAAKGWDRATDRLLIDQDIYDEKSKQWVREVKEPLKPKPSVLETFEVLEKQIVVNQNKDTGIVTIAFEHYSPYFAKDITDKLVLSINEYMRTRDLKEAERSIEYLNKKIEETNVSDAKTMLFSLIEEQTKILMLANVRPEYVFKTVDSAVVAEKKSKPARALICIVGFTFGLMVSVLIVILRFFRKVNI